MTSREQFKKETRLETKFQKKCDWIHQNDGEFTTQCKNEHHFGSLYSPCNLEVKSSRMPPLFISLYSPCDLEDDFQTLMFVYCPYCGGKINFANQLCKNGGCK